MNRPIPMTPGTGPASGVDVPFTVDADLELDGTMQPWLRRGADVRIRRGAVPAGLRHVEQETPVWRRAVAFSSFARLREREDREGFRGHKWNHWHPFFRSGESGAWRRHLTPAQARRVVHAHAGTMAAFGYDVSSFPPD